MNMNPRTPWRALAPPARPASTSLALLVVAASLAPASFAAAANPVYAAPGGNGSACTLLQPCSLEGARDKVRVINTPANTHDIVVYLRGGHTSSQAHSGWRARTRGLAATTSSTWPTPMRSLF